MGVAQQRRSALHLPCRDKSTDARGAHDLAVQRDGGDNIAAKTARGAVRRQLFAVALAAVAEAEVVADDEADSVILRADAVQKLAPRHVHRVLVEVDAVGPFDTEKATDNIGTVRRRAEQRHGRFFDENIRVEVKGQHRGLRAERGGARLCRVQQRGVSDMNAVEKAEREHGFGSLFHKNQLQFSKKFLREHIFPSRTPPRARNAPSAP